MEIPALVRRDLARVLGSSRGRDIAPRSSALDTQMRGAAVVPEGRVFHTLDALRGIAAIGVLVFHMGPIFTPIAAPGGYLAVDLFFMMSGVVLSHAYEARFRAGMGTLDFMRARLIRLYPLYLAGALLRHRGGIGELAWPQQPELGSIEPLTGGGARAVLSAELFGASRE